MSRVSRKDTTEYHEKSVRPMHSLKRAISTNTKIQVKRRDEEKCNQEISSCERTRCSARDMETVGQPRRSLMRRLTISHTPVQPPVLINVKRTLTIGRGLVKELVRSKSPSRTASKTLQSISPDTLLCIIDHLWFPDAFALAMTCKALYSQIALRSRKQTYAEALSEYSQSSAYQRQPKAKKFCAVCLYALDEDCYFWTSTYGEGRHRELEHGLRVCQQCEEFRERKAKTLAGEGDRPFPIWRRSTRETVPNYSGLLWYRCRE